MRFPSCGSVHPDGRTALEKGDVDAWAGLDPHMAASELQAGSRLLYRNKDFNSYGVISVTETFAKEHPQTIATVIKAYEKARHWAVAHPDQFAQLLAEEYRLPLDVAKLQLSRTDLSSPQPTAEDATASKAAAPILVAEAEAWLEPTFASLRAIPSLAWVPLSQTEQCPQGRCHTLWERL